MATFSYWYSFKETYDDSADRLVEYATLLKNKRISKKEADLLIALVKQTIRQIERPKKKARKAKKK